MPIHRTLARAAIPMVLGLSALAGCGKESGPAAPQAQLPPQIQSVMPPARSTRVLYDTDIWAQFDQPLDPATVGATTVFLKLDTRRLNASVVYEAATQRIRVTPQAPLALNRTYTIELSPHVATADGAALGGVYFWQFTTNGLRRFSQPGPPDGSTFESPFAGMVWDQTETTAGAVQYAVFMGSDSAAVAARAVTPDIVSTWARWLPRTRWPFGATVYWSVRATNLTLNEVMDGPVWRFEVLPDGLPIDSLTVNARHWGFYDRRPRVPVSQCGASMTIGPDVVTGIRWPLEDLPRTLKVAGFSLRMFTTAQTEFPSRVPSLWGGTEPWSSCALGYPGPPWTDETRGALAVGTYLGGNQYRIESDMLTAHVEATLRYHTLYGYVFRADRVSTYTPPSEVKLYYYQLP